MAASPNPSAADHKRYRDIRGRISSGFHGVLLAVAAAVFAWPIALPIGVVGAGLGALGGALLAGLMLERKFRLVVVVASGVAIGLVGALAELLLLDVSLLPGIVGGSVALELGDATRWLSLCAATATVMRGIALRYRAALAVEGSVVVIAVASTVAAHRDGMIARPLEVADWFWTRGLDPVVAFIGIGLLGAVLFAGVISKGRSATRTLLQLLFVMLLGVFLASKIHGLDSTDRRDVIGGSKDDEDKEKKDKERQAAKDKAEKEAQARAGNTGEPPPNQQDGQAFRNDDMPSPGSGGKQRPAAIVLFHKEAKPATGLFYFRHAAFSQFNGVRLVKTSRRDVDQDVEASFPSALREIPGVHNESTGRTLVATDVALLVDHPRAFALTDATAMAPLANPDPARFRRAYRVQSRVLTGSYEPFLGLRPGDGEWSDDVWEYYTELPDDERYYELAAELQAGLRTEFGGDPLAKALVIKQYLEKNATYSFKRKYEDEEDPTAAFLFSEEKLGYCVHLAHSAAFLMRAMGLPARVSAGYAVPSDNMGSGSALLIKQGDAHAWAELYLQDIGWVPIEVTPEKTDVEPPEFNEQDLQQLLGEMARKKPPENPEMMRGPQIWESIKEVLSYLPYVLMLSLLAAYFYKTWRAVAPWVTKSTVQPRVSYRAALDRLSAVGVVRRFGETREHFAERVEPLAPSFGAITDRHVASALGSPSARASERRLRELPELVSGVGREVRHEVPVWRWALGALNPISWLWSR